MHIEISRILSPRFHHVARRSLRLRRLDYIGAVPPGLGQPLLSPQHSSAGPQDPSGHFVAALSEGAATEQIVFGPNDYWSDGELLFTLILVYSVAHYYVHFYAIDVAVKMSIFSDTRHIGWSWFWVRPCLSFQFRVKFF